MDDFNSGRYFGVRDVYKMTDGGTLGFEEDGMHRRKGRLLRMGTSRRGASSEGGMERAWYTSRAAAYRSRPVARVGLHTRSKADMPPLVAS